ncbi:MAG: sortase [Candidatus Gottesmanbacteria bacterium]
MPLYRYVKHVSKPPVRRSIVVSFVFMGLGIGILAWTLWPIVSFSAITQNVLAKTTSPVAGSAYIAGRMIASTVQAADYQNPSSWYPNRPQKKVTATVNMYTLSIPKLKIQNANVIVSGDDLGVSLVHYGGTPLPGQYGNAVVFGHSTLPQFYNPKNYKSIFSFLPSMEIGDTATVYFDGIEYIYRVEDMIVVEPADLSPLEQRFDDSYMTLVTCVPPGTYWKRLNIKMRLVKNT